MPNMSRTFVIKKNTTSSSGRIPKNRMPVVCSFEMDQIVSFNARMSISDRYMPGMKIAQNTSLR
jgi:hypothetical protein